MTEATAPCPPLRVALGRSGGTAAFLDGTVGHDDLSLEFPSFPNILTPIRRMCRNLDLDVCEMPVCTYLLARAHGVPITAIPVFVLRRLPWSVLYRSLRPDLRSPADLVGHTVGIRSYSDTTGVWMRGILDRQYGLDSRRVNWLACDEEHVLGWSTPPNVRTDLGADHASMLDSGDLAATVKYPGRRDGSFTRWFDDPAHEAEAWLDATGCYPLSHTVVIRDDILLRQPGLAGALYSLIVRSTEAFGRDDSPRGGLQDWEREIAESGPTASNPYPQGLDANRIALETLIQFAREQDIVDVTDPIEALFAPIV